MSVSGMHVGSASSVDPRPDGKRQQRSLHLLNHANIRLDRASSQIVALDDDESMRRKALRACPCATRCAENYGNCIKDCVQSVKIKPTVKAYFRGIKASNALRKWEMTLEMCEKAMQVTLGSTVHRLLHQEGHRSLSVPECVHLFLSADRAGTHLSGVTVRPAATAVFRPNRSPIVLEPPAFRPQPLDRGCHNPPLLQAEARGTDCRSYAWSSEDEASDALQVWGHGARAQSRSRRDGSSGAATAGLARHKRTPLHRHTQRCQGRYHLAPQG